MDEELRRAALLLPPPYDRSVLALGVPVEDIRLRLGKNRALAATIDELTER